MTTPNEPTEGRTSRLNNVIGRSFELVDHVLDNVDTLVTTVRKDGLAVAREFTELQVAAAERFVAVGGEVLRDLRPEADPQPE